MKVFISADIEGTCGIAAWQETNTDNQYSNYFQTQMTREVAAACRGANRAGCNEIVVKDAHDSARNLYPNMLPPYVKILRGWPRDPYCMVSGIDKSFDAAIFTGYHSAANTAGNPLSHTMSTRIFEVKINGIVTSEFYINSLTASYLGIPSVLLTGDKSLCEKAKTLLPTINTVAVSEGTGNGALSLQPDTACEQIEEAAYKALTGDYKNSIMPLPEHFEIEITYKNHYEAYSGSFYPGVERSGESSIRYKSNDWFEVLRLIHFVM